MTARDSKLDSYWMPFTANRAFKQAPRMLVAAKDMHYSTDDGRQILDGTSGLWCVNAGHCRPRIVEAIQKQVAKMDYAPAFQMGHPDAFRVAERLAAMAPGDLDHVFYCNSGSEGVDTALKIALAYHRARGEGQRNVLIGRERGYHGAGFGGISVGGIPANRKVYGNMLFRVDHMAHTHNLKENAFSRGQPAWGAHLADELETRIVPLHDASNIAAVIVEPFSGSGGVVVPPTGYLQRLREICDQHQILLIFDEVISGFGRSGAWTGSEAFGVTPDILNFAKQVTNGVIPMGGVAVKSEIHDTFLAAGGPHYAIEFPHGYTYSGHPVACAAGLATLALLKEENVVEQVQALMPHFEAAVHGLKGLPHITDIRNFGLAAGITLAALPGEPARRPFEIAMRCWARGYYVRYGLDTLQFAPPFISTPQEISDLFGVVGEEIARQS